jgi:GMP synthase-like glutamine amidotransferase
MSRRRILILDLSLDPALYRPTEHWRALLGDVPSRRLHLSAEPAAELPGIGTYSHLIVTGSEASIVEPHPWLAPAEALIREAVEARRPVLGSCYGHQLVIRALLGPDHVRRARVPELGWLPVETTAGGAPVGEAGRRLFMFCCHFDEVCDLPPSYEVLARSPHCAVHAYRLAEGPVWGVQAHPEIDVRQGAALLRGFAAKRPELWPLVNGALASGARDDGFGRELVDHFLQMDVGEEP